MAEPIVLKFKQIAHPPQVNKCLSKVSRLFESEVKWKSLVVFSKRQNDTQAHQEKTNTSSLCLSFSISFSLFFHSSLSALLSHFFTTSVCVLHTGPKTYSFAAVRESCCVSTPEWRPVDFSSSLPSAEPLPGFNHPIQSSSALHRKLSITIEGPA